MEETTGAQETFQGYTEEGILAVLESIVCVICEDIAFDVHRAAKTGEITLEELQKSAIPPLSSKWNDDEDGNEASSRINLLCAHCGQKVSVQRYAPHLDKCMGKGRARRNASRVLGQPGRS